MIRKLTDRIPVPALYFLLPVLFAVASCWSAGKAPGDFANYYYASAFLRSGNFGSWIYDPVSFNEAIRQTGALNIFACYTPVPPITAICFLPFTFFSLPVAKGLMELSTAALFLFSLHRLLRTEGMDQRTVLGIPLLFFYPLLNHFLLGQTYFLELFLLCEGFIAYRQQRVIACALLWALAILLKIFPAILLLFLLVKKDWKQTGLVLGACLALVLATQPVTGMWTEYLSYILPRQMRGDINNPFAVSYQSVTVILKRLFVADSNLNPRPLVDAPLFYLLPDTFFKLLVLGLCATRAVRLPSDLGKFGLCLFCGLLVSGYGTSYGLLLALFFALYLISAKQWAPLLLLALACNIPVHLLGPLPPLLQFPRFYLLLAAFIFSLKGMSLPRPVWLAALLPPLLLVALLKEQEPGIQPVAVAPQLSALLTSHVEARPGTLTLHTFDREGPHRVAIHYPILTADTSGLRVTGRNIRRNGKLLTFGTDQKKEPVIINGKELFYLSDKGRGVGFYRLVKIPLP